MTLAFTSSIFISSLTLPSHSYGCDGEAQVVGIVSSASFIKERCIIKIGNVSSYASNPFCPLSVDEINADGVTLSILTSDKCGRQLGHEISGVVVKTNGLLELE